MTHLTGFNYTEVNKHYVVYPETLEIEDLIHKHVQLQKEFDAVIKCNEEEKVLLKSVDILRKEVTTILNEIPWPPQASHLTVESSKIPERLNYFLQKLFSRKYTDIDSPRVSRLKLSFPQDLIYAMTHGTIKYLKSILFPYAIKSLTNNSELINITHKYGDGISHTILEELDTEYALLQLNRHEETGGVVLPTSDCSGGHH